MKALEKPRHFLLGDADPSVANAQFRNSARRTQRDSDLSLESEFEGVGDEVQHHLLPHFPIHIDGLGELWAVDRKPQTRLFRRRPEDARELRRESGEVGGLEDRAHAARFDARKVQQRVNQAQEPQAVTLRHLELTFGRRRQRRASAREKLLDGPEHQRERRSELMTDVREEYGLGSVDLRQRLGALFFCLELSRVGDARGDLRGCEVQKVQIGLVELEPGADARHQEARQEAGLVGADRRDDGGIGRVAPGPWRYVAPKSGREVRHGLHRVAAHGCGERPKRIVLQRTGRRTGPRASRDADRTCESRRLAIRVDQIEQGERDVLCMRSQGLGRERAGLFRRLRLDGPRAQITQRRHAPVAHHFFCDLVDGRQHPADPALDRFVGRGAVGDREMAFLDETVPVDLQADVVVPAWRTALERTVDQRSDDMPDLRPALVCWAAQRLVGVFGSGDAAVGVVVKLDVVRTPPEYVRKAVGEEYAHHRPQRGRPGFERSERRLRPVERVNALLHLTRADRVLQLSRHRSAWMSHGLSGRNIHLRRLLLQPCEG